MYTYLSNETTRREQFKHLATRTCTFITAFFDQLRQVGYIIFGTQFSDLHPPV